MSFLSLSLPLVFSAGIQWVGFGDPFLVFLLFYVVL